jgi:hypothetical protein
MAHACKRMNNLVGLLPIQSSSILFLQSIGIDRALLYCFAMLTTADRSSQLIY